MSLSVRLKNLSLVTLLLIGVLTLSDLSVSATIPGVTTLISRSSSNSGQGGDNHSDAPNGSFNRHVLSDDGLYIAYNSIATDLVLSDTNSKKDVFLVSRENLSTSIVSISTAGTQGDQDSELISLSETGRYVVFRSKSTNLIDGQTISSANYHYYLRDTNLNTTIKLDIAGNISSVSSISSDGRYILYGYVDSSVRLYDRALNTHTNLGLGPVDSSGITMSCDGAFIAFDSDASSLVSGDTNGFRDIFLVDIRNGQKITNITQSANNNSFHPYFSCNGNYIGFSTEATNLGSGHTSSYRQAYRYDRIDETFAHISQSTAGSPSNNTLNRVFGISNKGDVLFSSNAKNLVANHNHVIQHYLRRVENGTTDIITINSSGISHSTGAVWRPWRGMSSDGKYSILSALDASNFMSGDSNGYRDLFIVETGL